ncbi:MAG: redoxin family protein [Planctomycetaceae bacterium]
MTTESAAHQARKDNPGLALGLLGVMILLALPATVYSAAGATDELSTRGRPLLERFQRLDANRDGKLTPAELPRPDIFGRLDADKNGEVTLEEARAGVVAGVLKRMEMKEQIPGPSVKPSPRPDSVGATVDAADSVRKGPDLLSPGEHGVGDLVADLQIEDIDGSSQKLSQLLSDPREPHSLVVFAMTSTSCPLSRKYLPTLARLSHEYSSRGVQFVCVNPMASDKRSDIDTARKTLAEGCLYLIDPDEAVAEAIGAASTTDVIVVDRSRTVVFHGAVDDQYGLGYSHDAPRKSFLSDALEALLADRQPLVTATDAPGCLLNWVLEPSDANHLHPNESVVTWHGRISRLMQRHCVECHRDGGVAPFSLESYADVVAHAPMIRDVVARGVMPPWFAARSDNDAGDSASGELLPGSRQHSPWINDRSLSASERQDLLAWISGNRAEGNPMDAVIPKTYPNEWAIGEPDAIFEFKYPVAVKATGTMPYQNVVVETNLPEDKWVKAIEVRPGAPEVVHHVLVFVQDGDGSTRDSIADESRGYWGIYVPGNSTLTYPDGYGKKLPRHARLRFQMHYTPNGAATTDQTRIGLVYAEHPPKHEVKVTGIVNPRLRIPPGADNHREVAKLLVPADAKVLAFLPHMHLRGKAARFELVSNRSTTTLLDIPRYDFNWQLLYRYAEPLQVHRGDQIVFTAWFDNSSDNPANPDPNRTVRWGPQTTDEMHLGYVEYILD